jgi:hypothetical protein
MTYYGAKELGRSFRTVRDNTIKIAEEIPEEKYGFRPAEGCRSIAETLVHIAVMSRVPEQIHAVDHRKANIEQPPWFSFFAQRSSHPRRGSSPDPCASSRRHQTPALLRCGGYPAHRILRKPLIAMSLEEGNPVRGPWPSQHEAEWCPMLLGRRCRASS